LEQYKNIGFGQDRLRPKSRNLKAIPGQTFGCDPRLPESGHVFRGLGTDEPRTLLSFVSPELNGNFPVEGDLCGYGYAIASTVHAWAGSNHSGGKVHNDHVDHSLVPEAACITFRL
jgi:hypothetical protein